MPITAATLHATLQQGLGYRRATTIPDEQFRRRSVNDKFARKPCDAQAARAVLTVVECPL